MNEPRQDATSPDLSRQDATEDFTGVLNVPSPSYTLNIYEVAARFDQAGKPRNRRSLMRYCQQNKLDARKVETSQGEMWMVDETSVDRLIQQLITLDQQTPTGRDKTRPDAPLSPAMDGSTAPATMPDNDATGRDTPRQDQTNNAAAGETEKNNNGSMVGETDPDNDATGRDRSRHENDGIVEQLEKRLEEKDGEIDFLRGEIATKNMQIATSSEREKETNVLIQGLQSMVLKLTGKDMLPAANSFDAASQIEPAAAVHEAAPINPPTHQNQSQNQSRGQKQNGSNNHNFYNQNKKNKRNKNNRFSH